MLLLGIVDDRRRRRAWEITQHWPDFNSPLWPNAFLLGYHASAFVEIVDAACVNARRRIWIEKTPDHLFYIRHIQKYVPDVRVSFT